MKTLLYATDCSKTNMSSIQYANRLCNVMEAELYILHVYDYAPYASTAISSSGLLKKHYADEQNNTLQEYCNDALKHELVRANIKLLAKAHGSISKSIEKTAYDINADLVMVGIKNHNTTWSFFTGNIANDLMTALSCPLLILPNEFNYHGLSTLLYTTDFEASDIDAIESLVEFAEPYGALIKVVHIPLEHEYDVESSMQTFRESIKQRITYPEITFSIMRAEDVESGIHQYIQQEMPEMLVMLEREQQSLWSKLFHKDMVQTMEDEVSIPLLVFNKKSIKAKLIEAPEEISAMQFI